MNYRRRCWSGLKFNSFRVTDGSGTVFKKKSTRYIFNLKWIYFYKIKVKTCHSSQVFRYEKCHLGDDHPVECTFQSSAWNRPSLGPTAVDRSWALLAGWHPSTRSNYGVCECTHGPSGTPRGKKSHDDKSGDLRGHGTSPYTRFLAENWKLHSRGWSSPKCHHFSYLNT